MKVQYKKVFAKTAAWLAVEILLNFLGLDELADYSEFIFESKQAHWVLISAEVTTPSDYPRKNLVTLGITSSARSYQ